MDDRKAIQEILKRVQVRGRKHYLTNWRRGGMFDRGFTPWTPRKKRYNHPILIKSKKMYNSFNTYRRGDKAFFQIGTTYAQYHQEGTSKLPQRKLLYDSEKFDRQCKLSIDEVMHQYFRGFKPNVGAK